jgi:Circularly permutated YpsA SLOG family
MKILSGGQTGVDRAVLDTAIEKRVAYGGWCPRGGWAEDLPDPPGLLAIYPKLQETPQAQPVQRTEWNVRDCDGLMVLVDRRGLSVSNGTEHALGYAETLGKPHIVIDLDGGSAIAQGRAWLADRHSPFDLCIAGPRESEAPGIYAKACAFLRALFDTSVT